MSYQTYSLDWLVGLINKEILAGVDLLSSSYISRKYDVPPDTAQRALADMAESHKLDMIFRALCSGEHQNYDIDIETTDSTKIPRYLITCHVCGDRYTPSDENILIYFSPTAEYRRFLNSSAKSHAG